ncbi:MAG: hypothetical protein K2J09_05175 [Muribaculaceae bacterium]|nr:hypothetical protein [Muribaculaceae bacterium]
MKKTIISAMLLAASAAGASAQTAGTGAVIESETLKVWFDNISLVADGTTITKMTVYESDIYDYTAYNMAFNVPKGIKIAMVKKGRETVPDVEMSERAASTHSIAIGQPADDLVKVLTFSSQLDNLYPDDEDGNPMEELYTIGFTADPSMVDGDYEVEMWDIKFVLANTDACVPKINSYKGIFTITGGQPATDIKAVETPAGSDDGEYFDLLGRPAGRNPQPGVYIRNNQKVIVK